jgi:purine nucleosidase
LLALDSPRAQFFRRISRRSIDVTERTFGQRTLSAPDLLAVAVAIEPDIVLEAEMHHVRVELAGQYTRGHTTVDWRDRTGKKANVNVALTLDAERLWELLWAAVV